MNVARLITYGRNVALLLLGLQASVFAADPPVRVLTSIKPLQLIAVAVTGEPGMVESLLDPRKSHHEYQLRPSERGRLERADVIFWVGPDLETFLRRPMAALPDHVRVESLLPGQIEQAGPERGGHAHVDAHIWLDPVQAIGIARRMAVVLSERVPAESRRWHDNAERFATELLEEDRQLRGRLTGHSLRPYLVMHDAYGHFEASYGLRRAATLATTPEQQPGARHLLHIRQLFERGAIQCVFQEPQYDSKSLRALLQEYSPRVAILDPMAISAPVTRTGFVAFYREFGRVVAACLEE
jgi:zinc transport system substrate-binding protein